MFPPLLTYSEMFLFTFILFLLYIWVYSGCKNALSEGFMSCIRSLVALFLVSSLFYIWRTNYGQNSACKTNVTQFMLFSETLPVSVRPSACCSIFVLFRDWGNCCTAKLLCIFCTLLITQFDWQVKVSLSWTFHSVCSVSTTGLFVCF